VYVYVCYVCVMCVCQCPESTPRQAVGVDLIRVDSENPGVDLENLESVVERKFDRLRVERSSRRLDRLRSSGRTAGSAALAVGWYSRRLAGWFGIAAGLFIIKRTTHRASCFILKLGCGRKYIAPGGVAASDCNRDGVTTATD
jgi:hypothetical protein